MADIKHDHYMLGVIDLIEHPPVAAEAGAVNPGQLRTERQSSANLGRLGAGLKHIHQRIMRTVSNRRA
jgi:hypothetical protein